MYEICISEVNILVTFSDVALTRQTFFSKLFGCCHFKPLWSFFLLTLRMFFDFWIVKVFT